MRRFWNVFKYLIRDTLTAVAVYYVIIMLLLILGFTLQISYNNVKIGFNGLKVATVTFLFVAGLNAFKAPYLFMHANGVTRRSFFRGGVLALAALAVGMTLIDEAMYGLLRWIAPPEDGLMPMLYPNGGFIGALLWTAAANLFAVFTGWCITMLYYRVNKFQKLVLSLLPAVLFISLTLIDPVVGCWKGIASVLMHVMGLAGTKNIYIGVLSMLIASTLMAAFAFLLVRRAQVKEQDR